MAGYFSGRVHSVMWNNEDFYVLRVVLDGDPPGPRAEGPIGVKGLVPGMNLDIGSWFGFEAKWETHPKFGRQLSITKAPVVKGEWTPETASAMLHSHGITERLMMRMNTHFGDELVEGLNRADEAEIGAITGITPFSAALIVKKWISLRALFKTLEFLADAKVPKHKISEVWARFGEKAKAILTENPWALVRIEGIRFEQADEVARRLDLDMKSPFRVEGAALYASKNRRGMGHMFLSSGDMRDAVQGICNGSTPEDVAMALANLHKEGSLTIDRKTRPGTTAIYEPWFRHLEQECATLLIKRVETAEPTAEPESPDAEALRAAAEARRVEEDRGRDRLDAALDAALEAASFKPYAESLSAVGLRSKAAWDADPLDYKTIAAAALDDVAEGSHIVLADAQRTGALNALVSPVSVLAGLPGTGKTTTLQTVVAVLKEADVPFLLVAPTGIAAKRMSSLAQAPAATIHRAFHAKGWSTGSEREANYTGVTGDSKNTETSVGSGEEWGFSPDNPHPARVIICDEASMLDQHLLFRILTCTHPKARLVLVGDPAQLPSVGPGNVLRDIINTRMFPTIELTEIYRQEETSDIVRAAHATFRGNIPVTGLTKGSDFVLWEESDEDSVLNILTQLVGKLYKKNADAKGASEVKTFQVLSPRHGGTLGVTNLNQRLRTVLNPASPGLQEHRLGKETIREDDRVMVVKNNYKLNIFNGDVGKVSRIDRKARVIEIKLHGPPVALVSIPFKEAGKFLRLAYCVTVHKCVHPDTLTETTEGLLPIRDIPGLGDIATPDGERSYQNKVVNPEGPAVRITTRGGYTLTTTPDHGMDVWDGEQYIRREAGDVREGDLLRLKLGVTSDPVIPVLLPPAPPHDVRAKVHHLPFLMDPFVAEFLGLMVADGTVYPKGFRLAKRHEDTVDRFVELCRHLFKVEAHRFFKLGAHHAEVNSTFLSAWLSSVGGLDPHAKGVPECVLRSHSGLQANFLRGLFADGSVNLKDGCLDHVEWTCKFDSLPNVVRTMLLRLGIPCGTTPGRGIHTLYIYGEYARRFGEIVGFPSEAKRERLLLSCGKQTKYFVPVSKAEAQHLRAHHLEVLGHSTCGNAVQRGRLSLHNLNLLIDSGASTSVVAVLQERALFHHEPVASLEATTCPSMCIEVPEGHRFLQNGFSAWNSQGQEYDMIIMPLVKGFGHQLQRNLFYTAITRAKKRVYLIGQEEALIRAVGNNREDIRNTLFPDRLTLALKGGSLSE